MTLTLGTLRAESARLVFSSGVMISALDPAEVCKALTKSLVLIWVHLKMVKNDEFSIFKFAAQGHFKSQLADFLGNFLFVGTGMGTENNTTASKQW